MQNFSDNNDPSLKTNIRNIQSYYNAKFPEKKNLWLDTRDQENIKAIYESCNRDMHFIKKAIMDLPDKMKDGEIPTYAFALSCIRSAYEAKVKDKSKFTEEELLEMCEFTPRQQMYMNITQRIITDIIPAEEPPLGKKGFKDPNILKVLIALHEGGRIDDEMLNDGLRGYELLGNELSEIGDAILHPEKQEVR